MKHTIILLLCGAAVIMCAAISINVTGPARVLFLILALLNAAMVGALIITLVVEQRDKSEGR